MYEINKVWFVESEDVVMLFLELFKHPLLRLNVFLQFLVHPKQLCVKASSHFRSIFPVDTLLETDDSLIDRDTSLDQIIPHVYENEPATSLLFTFQMISCKTRLSEEFSCLKRNEKAECKHLNSNTVHFSHQDLVHKGNGKVRVILELSTAEKRRSVRVLVNVNTFMDTFIQSLQS